VGSPQLWLYHFVDVNKMIKLLKIINMNKKIRIDSEKGKQFGFTTQLFHPVSYLWEQDNYIIISLIHSRKKGNFKKLVDNIINAGYGIKIPTPTGDMKRIVSKNNYKKTYDKSKIYGIVEVWIQEPTNKKALSI
jgi:hypothetical protein